MVTLKLAIRNLIGAGLRTWLNVIVLSFAFLAIITTQGLLQGMNEQAARAMIEAEVAGGQFWHPGYDPYDPLTLETAHGPIPQELQDLIQNEAATPVLIIQGSVYPGGRMRTVLLKGIDPGQEIIAIPSHFLATEAQTTPAIIGNRMARNTGLKIGDMVTIQWRDRHGTFDAQDIEIVQIMQTSVPTIDNGQIWLPLGRLQELAEMPGEATMVILSGMQNTPLITSAWPFQSVDILLKDLHDMVASKSLGSTIFYLLLMFLAMLAIFDTQVLAVFRRRKEIGTLMALGMTRWRVISIFTVEGGIHGVVAVLVGAVYGLPLLWYFTRVGWALPSNTDSYGFAIGEKLFPVFPISLVIGTALLVMIVTTIVSFLPLQRILKLKPTAALRGRVQ